ncbi:MAG: tRNA (N6-threonylcarbamoyladenosine(37)-N6)-methyltransferase TrmO [Thermodesulfobacteriota bacterium]|nr:tRNA (N6-threonylcarbamoyladenosine(37)-N6)-methyltransferase TrmO [Thermodesulfobacteriota bacterium]
MGNEEQKKVISLKPIGIIHSPYKIIEEIPNQGYKSKYTGIIEVFKEYEEGLADLDEFSHLILLFLFHKSNGYFLKIKPFFDINLRGLFATRSPKRPNPIGLSVVRLLERNDNMLDIAEIDMLDGTPLLDIKPYVPHFDQREVVKVGWLEGKIKTVPSKNKER